MQVNDLSSIDPNVDYTQILPIQQKRTIAFINHFVMNTVSFLNHFAQSCESRLMEFEYKLQEVEASLLILESQLGSIAHLEENTAKDSPKQNDLDLPPVKDEETQIEKNVEVEPDVASDPRYQRFFKMLQFGVPPAAVKLKMQTEGLDPCILDSKSTDTQDSSSVN
ncbi:WASH complex subunit 3 [Tribolium castaneum]|uniref:WASH complex subunit CCDC53 homolog-like Protein n=1 Tax=Tribolium castaneum TaxID=7070 RepID=D2A1Y8_TRICA|nr:PREDICTED: WASH complex subunit CCDC53 homolog [Tribolium castaneum]EFA02065.2 WASH complex subunit CCDC53 homolog-like Protein [Tribolium castaneum]|eukprot:XP_973654.2 PREDICTED: WASH complex subunit CCDC53 homolog [Tribolium castaneum]